MGSTTSRGVFLVACPRHCAHWRRGWSSSRSRKWRWNRPRSTGNPSGEPWSGTGNRPTRRGKGRSPRREHSTLRRRCRTAGGAAARRISVMPNVLVKRLVAHELVLSFVPDVEQRLWRTVVRTKYQLTRNRVQLQNRLEALLEEAHIKLSSLVSDLLGASARRMLGAIAGGETNRETLAALADRGLRATQEQLQDALGVCQELNPVYRRLIKMVLDEVASIDKRIEQLNQEMANLLRPHEDQVKRLAEVPGLGRSEE